MLKKQLLKLTKQEYRALARQNLVWGQLYSNKKDATSEIDRLVAFIKKNKTMSNLVEKAKLSPANLYELIKIRNKYGVIVTYEHAIAATNLPYAIRTVVCHNCKTAVPCDPKVETPAGWLHYWYRDLRFCPKCLRAADAIIAADETRKRPIRLRPKGVK